MSTNATIAIDGKGLSHFNFHIGSISHLHFEVGENTPIHIVKATTTELVAGNCRHNKFSIDIVTGTGNEILEVKIENGEDVSCNFTLDGSQLEHITPKTTKVLKYLRNPSGLVSIEANLITQP